MPRHLAPALTLALGVAFGHGTAATGAGQTAAEAFAPHRGLNLDTWVHYLNLDEIFAQPGFLDVFPEWRRYATPAMTAKLAADGFDFIRLPIDPAPLLRLGPGPAQDALIAQTLATVKDLQGYGLKVIVDLHSIPRADAPEGTAGIVASPAAFDRYLVFVGRVGAALNGLDPTRTAYEPFNEPNHDCDAIYSGDAQAWPAQLLRLHAVARKHAPALPLVLSGACWGDTDSLLALDPAKIDDANVIWSFHSYQPFAFTHQSADWVDGPVEFLADIPYPPSGIDDALAAKLLAKAVRRAKASPTPEGRAATKADLAQTVQDYRDLPDNEAASDPARAAAWADRHGISHARLLLGEFGVTREDPQGNPLPRPQRARFLADKRRAAERHGIGWAVYSWTGALRTATDDQSRVIAPDVCTALGLPGC
ncbi:MAG: cellulase family glycosylhydrolase [Paracoccaceae bacterium]|nr:cellulase family glycosylhydrolase [Paracoccaceae bacterium]